MSVSGGAFSEVRFTPMTGHSARLATSEKCHKRSLAKVVKTAIVRRIGYGSTEPYPLSVMAKKILTVLHVDFIVNELIIFDSDGVLVDSEKIALAVLVQAASDEGAAIGVDEGIRLFRGLKFADCMREIERRSGRSVRENFVADVRRATACEFATVRLIDLQCKCIT
jgi:hypothetical protein